MTIQFNRNGKTFTADVVGRGFYEVDQPECYEVHIGPVVVHVPVSEATVIPTR